MPSPTEAHPTWAASPASSALEREAAAFVLPFAEPFAAWHDQAARLGLNIMLKSRTEADVSAAATRLLDEVSALYIVFDRAKAPYRQTTRVADLERAFTTLTRQLEALAAPREG